MEQLSWLFPQLSTLEWTAHISIFIINIALLLFAEPLLNIVESGKEIVNKVKLFKALNILVLILHVLDLIVLRANPAYEHYLIRIGLSLMTLYAGLFTFSLGSFFSRKRFGHEKLIDNKSVFLETYSTRVVDIIILTFIAFTAVYILIKIWGADSLLETTGIFGIIVAFLAFTSNIWGPDIISGLIILNSQILETGDVVVIDGYDDEYIINKVSFIYIILYDLRNNHRTLVRNSRFIQSKIDNLSRIASTDGVRQNLQFNIGYADIKGATSDERLEEINYYYSRIDRMFQKANEVCCENSEIKINNNKPFEWAITNTGDYALEYTLWFYLERIPNSKNTATIRKHLMGTIYKINKVVYTQAFVENIQLATPELNTVSFARNQEIPVTSDNI